MTTEKERVHSSSELALPEGWRRVTLGSIADVYFSNVDKLTNDGERPVRLCNYMDVYSNDYIVDGMPFMHASATKSEIARFSLKRGDVIITKDSETPDDIGIPAVMDEAATDLLCGYHLALIRPHLDEVDPTFLVKQLGHPTTARFFGCRATGSTRFGLANSTVENTPLLLPPLKAQQAIASLVRSVGRAIEQTEALIAKYQRIKTGLMQDLLTRGINEHGRLRDPTTHKFKPSPLGQIPIEWTVHELEAMTEEDSPITYGVVKPGSEDPQGVLFVRGGDFPNGEILLDQLRTITRNVSEQYKRTILRGGEIVMSLVGQPGACAVVPAQLAGANLARQAALIRLKSQFDPQFFRDYLSGQLAQCLLLGETIGSVQSVINLNRLRKLPIPAPLPQEQSMIAQRAWIISRCLESEELLLTKLRRLKTGLMQDLLTGKVSVEPLLETQTAA